MESNKDEQNPAKKKRIKKAKKKLNIVNAI